MKYLIAATGAIFLSAAAYAQPPEDKDTIISNLKIQMGQLLIANGNMELQLHKMATEKQAPKPEVPNEHHP